jgi:hypothetical protein
MNIRLIVTVLLFGCVFSGFVVAQNNPKNNVYAEVLGFSFRHSVGYERVVPVLKNRAVLIAGNAGVGLIQYRLSKGFTVPTGIKICAGWYDIYGELGINFLYVNEKSPEFYRTRSPWGQPTSTFFTLYHAGIRYQPRKKGLFLRGIAFPIKSEPGEKEVLNYYMGETSHKTLVSQNRTYMWWVGLSVGYSF